MTDERVEQFAGAPLTEQRAALAELRQRASSDEAGINIGIFGLLVAALVAFINYITKKVRLLAASDPDTLSGKAAKARDYGITIVNEEGLARLIAEL